MEVVCDMKSLVTPFDAAELAKFCLAPEEKLPPSIDLPLPDFLGFEFGTAAAEMYRYEERPPSPDKGDLSDPDSLDTLPSLDDEDYEILDAVRLSSIDRDQHLAIQVESVSHTKWTLDSETMLMKPRKKHKMPVVLKNVDPERWCDVTVGDNSRKAAIAVRWIKDAEAEKKTQIRPLNFQKPSRKRKMRSFASKEAYLRSIQVMKHDTCASIA